MGQFIIPYLMFKNSLAASEYYRDIFDGEIVYTMLGKDMPDCPKEDLEKVMHLELKIQGHFIYMSDGEELPSDQSMLLLNYENLDIMKNHYHNMVKTSKVIQELHDTFWGAVYGVLEDKYGLKWEFHFMKPRE